jgi:hypothetical protein
MTGRVLVVLRRFTLECGCTYSREAAESGVPRPSVMITIMIMGRMGQENIDGDW